MLEFVPENPGLETAIERALESLRPNVDIKKINLSATEDGRWIIDLPTSDSLKLYDADLEQIWLMVADRIAEKHGASGLDNVFLREPYKEPEQIQEYWAKKRAQIEEKVKTHALLGLLNYSIQNKLALSEAELQEFWANPKPRAVLYKTHCVGKEFGDEEPDQIDIYVIYSDPGSKLKQGIRGFKTEKDAWAAIEGLKEHYRSLADKVSSEQALQSAPNYIKDKFTEQCPDLAHLPDQIALNIYHLMNEGKGRILIEDLAKIDSYLPSKKSAKALRDKALTPPKSFEEAACLLISQHLMFVFLNTIANEDFKASLLKIKFPKLEENAFSDHDMFALKAVDELCCALRARILKVSEDGIPRLYNPPLSPQNELIPTNSYSTLDYSACFEERQEAAYLKLMYWLVERQDKWNRLYELSNRVQSLLGLSEDEIDALRRFAVMPEPSSNDGSLISLAKEEHVAFLNQIGQTKFTLSLNRHPETKAVRALRDLFKFIRKQLKDSGVTSIT